MGFEQDFMRFMTKREQSAEPRTYEQIQAMLLHKMAEDARLSGVQEFAVAFVKLTKVALTDEDFKKALYKISQTLLLIFPNPTPGASDFSSRGIVEVDDNGEENSTIN